MFELAQLKSETT